MENTEATVPADLAQPNKTTPPSAEDVRNLRSPLYDMLRAVVVPAPDKAD